MARSCHSRTILLFRFQLVVHKSSIKNFIGAGHQFSLPTAYYDATLFSFNTAHTFGAVSGLTVGITRAERVGFIPVLARALDWHASLGFWGNTALKRRRAPPVFPADACLCSTLMEELPQPVVSDR